MPIGTIAAIGGAIIGSSLIGASASRKAASAQAGAATQAADLQMQQYQQSREDFAPWRETGGRALSQLENLYMPQNGLDQQGGLGRVGGALANRMGGQFSDDPYGGFQETPGYQFRYDEGLRAMDRSAAARGRLQGGGYGRELQRYGQGIASQEFGNYANRLASLAGVGQTATAQTGQLGAQAAGQAGSAIQNAGTARASGYAGAANALTGGIQSGLTAYGAFGGGGLGGGTPNYGSQNPWANSPF